MCHPLKSTSCILKGTLVVPYQPVCVLLFSQSTLKGNAKHYCSHSPKEIPDEKHLSVAERIRVSKVFILIFEYVSENVIWCQYKAWAGWHKLRQLMHRLPSENNQNYTLSFKQNIKASHIIPWWVPPTPLLSSPYFFSESKIFPNNPHLHYCFIMFWTD